MQARTSRQKEAEALQRATASPKEADDEFLIRLRRLRCAHMSTHGLIRLVYTSFCTGKGRGLVLNISLMSFTVLRKPAIEQRTCQERWDLTRCSLTGLIIL